MISMKISGLTKRYGRKEVLSDFSVTFIPGIYGILGANGAGKSTLMNLITDNVKREGGEIRVSLDEGTDEEILKMGENYFSLLGYMPQQQGIYEQMTAESFVTYMGRLKGLHGKFLHSDAERVLKLTNLYEVRHKAAGEFSGGMKQRLLLAQALLGDPRILLLDEPTAGLDPKERIRIRNFIKELSADRIVLLATHIVSDIESIADQVLLMKNGKLIAENTPEALIASLPENWKPLAYRNSLEDVYLYYLGE